MLASCTVHPPLSATVMSDWSLLAPDLLFLHILSHVDSNTFFHQLPCVSKRWAAAQSDDRWFDGGSRWVDSIAARLRLSASQSRAWQDGSMDMERLRQWMTGWKYAPANNNRRFRRSTAAVKAAPTQPTSATLRVSCSLLWRALRSLQWQLMVKQRVGVRQVDGSEVCEYYDVPLALHQYGIDWLTVRQLPICFTAGEVEEETDEGELVPGGLIWDSREWWTEEDMSEQLLDGLWNEDENGRRIKLFDTESDQDDELDVQQPQEEAAEVAAADSDAMHDSSTNSSSSSDSDDESNASQQPTLQLDATDWPGLPAQLGWLTSDCPLLEIACLMQCSCFHACAYPADNEYAVTGVWTGPVPDMASFNALYATVDFASEKEVVAERCLQAEAALSRSLQLSHGSDSHCSECAITPIVGAMFVESDADIAAALCDACYHKQPRPGYLVSLRAWLEDAQAHPTHQPDTLDDSPVVDLFHNREQPRLDALCIRDVFLNREPSGAAGRVGTSRRARAALAEWLHEPVAVDAQQGAWARIHMYDELESGERVQEQENEERKVEGVVGDEKVSEGVDELVVVLPTPQDVAQQQRRLALGRLLSVYWQSVLSQAFAAALKEWRRLRTREAEDPGWRWLIAVDKQKRADEQHSDGDSDDDADVQLQDGCDPLWDEANALEYEEEQRITQALAALPEPDRPPYKALEEQLQMLAGQWLKRSRDISEQQQVEDEAPSSKRQAVEE